MQDIDVTENLKLATSVPDEAAQNIEGAKEFNIEPMEYKKLRPQLEPLRAKPLKVGRSVASVVSEDTERASLMKAELGKMNSLEKLWSYTKDQFSLTDVSREVSELSNKKRRQGGTLSEDDEMTLAIARAKQDELGKKEDLYDYNIAQGLPSKIVNVGYDYVRGLVSEADVIAATAGTTTTLGAGIGLVAGPAGAVAGAKAGLITGTGWGIYLAGVKDTYERTTGDVYNTLDTMTDDKTGEALNISENTKDGIAMGAAGLSVVIDAIADKKLADQIPWMKAILSPESLKRMVQDPAKLAMLDNLANFGSAVGAGMRNEAIAESLQEIVAITSEEIGKTWDGKEASFFEALGNISNKLATNPKYRAQMGARVGKSALIGGVAGGTFVAGGRAAGAAGQKIKKVFAKTPPTVEGVPVPPVDSGSIPVESQVDPKTAIVMNGNIPAHLSPSRSLQLMVALNESVVKFTESEVGDKAPQVLHELQAKIMKDYGIPNTWMDQDDLTKLATDDKRAAKLRSFLGVTAANTNGPVMIKPEIAIQIVKEFPEAAGMFRPEPEALSGNEVAARLEEFKAKKDKFFSSEEFEKVRQKAPVKLEAGVPAPEGTDVPAPPQDVDAVALEQEVEGEVLRSKLHHQSTDEDIMEAVRTREGADKFLAELHVREQELDSTPDNVENLLEVKTKKKIKEIENTTIDELEALVAKYNPDFMEMYNWIRDDIATVEAGAEYPFELKSMEVKGQKDVTPFDVQARRDEILEILKGLEQSYAERLPKVAKRIYENSKVIEMADQINRIVGPQNKKNNLKTLRERVQAVREQLPMNPEEMFKPENITAAEEDYINGPIFTEEVKKMIQDPLLHEILDAQLQARQAHVDAVREATELEMTEVLDINRENALVDEMLAAAEDIKNNDAIRIVENFKSLGFKINPKSLTEQQRIKYINDVGNNEILKRRQVFNTKAGVDAEAVARMLGVKDGETLLNILATTPNRKEALEQNIQLRKAALEEALADTVDLNETAAIKSLTDVAHRAEQEMRWLIENRWPVVRRAIERMTLRLPKSEVMDQEMKSIVYNTPVKDLNVNQWIVAYKKSNAIGLRAMLRNKVFEASKAAEAKFRNAMGEKYTRLAIAKTNRAIRKMVRIAKNPRIEAELKKAGPKYVNAMNEILDVFNIDADKKGTSQRGAFEKFVKERIEAGQGDMGIPAELIATLDPRFELNELTVDQVMYLANKMQEIVTAAREQNVVNYEQDKVAMSIIRDEVKQRAEAHPDFDPNRAVIPQGPKTAVQSIRNFLRGWDNGILNVNYITIMLDRGVRGGFFNKLIYQTLKGTAFGNVGWGEAGLNDLRAQISDQLSTAIEKHLGAKAFESLSTELVDIPEFKGNPSLGNGRLTKMNLVIMLANFGAEVNRSRLVNFGIPLETLLSVLERELPVEVFNIVQEGIWDNYHGLRPRIAALEKQTKGNDIEFVESIPFEAHGKVFAGGYYPLKYDFESDSKQATEAEKRRVDAALGDEDVKYQDSAASRGMTRDGYTEQREEYYEGKINLSPLTMAMGFEEVAVDLAMRVPVYETMKLLKDKDIAHHIKSVIGPERYKLLVSHVLETSRSVYVGRLELYADQEKYFRKFFDRYIRRPFAASQIAWNPTSLAMQFTSPLITWREMGYGSAKDFAANMRFFTTKLVMHPKMYEAYFDFAAEIDPTIKAYRQNVDDFDLGGIAQHLGEEINPIFNTYVTRKLKEINKKSTEIAFRRILGGADVLQKVVLISVMYRQFMAGKAKGYDAETLAAMPEDVREAQAKAYIVSMVNSTLTAGSMLERSWFQKSPMLAGWMMFFNDVRNAANYTVLSMREINWKIKDSVQQSKEGDTKGAIRSTIDAGAMLTSLLFMAAMVNTWKRTVKGETGDDEDEMAQFLSAKWEEQLFNNAVESLVKSPLYLGLNLVEGTPYLRSATYSFGQLLEGKKVRGNLMGPIEAQALVDFGFTGLALYRAMVHDVEMNPNDERDMMKSFGYLTSTPMNALYKLNKELETTPDQPFEPGMLLSVAGAFANLLGYLDQLPTAQAPTLPPEQVEEMKEVAQAVIDVADPVRVLDQEAIRKGADPLDDGEYEIIKHLESDGIWNNRPPKWKKDGRGRVMRDKDGKKIQERDAKGNLLWASTAFGYYQFTEDTWKGIMRNNPELELTENGRFDEDGIEQEVAMRAFVKELSLTLLRNGVQPTLETIYASHHFDPTRMAKLWKMDDGDIIPEDIVTPKEKSANDWADVMTVGAFKKGIRGLLKTGEEKYIKSLEGKLD